MGINNGIINLNSLCDDIEMIFAFILFLLFLYIYLQDILLAFTQFRNINNILGYFVLLSLIYLHQSLLYIIFILPLIVKSIKKKKNKFFIFYTFSVKG